MEMIHCKYISKLFCSLFFRFIGASNFTVRVVSEAFMF